jgi:hypothetical protein
MANKLTISTLEVCKDNWSETRVVTEILDGELEENEVLAGKTDPASGQIISLWPQGVE